MTASITCPNERHVSMSRSIMETQVMLENESFENANNLVIAEMQQRVRLAAYPARPGESVKAAIRRASIRLLLPFSMARRFWYGLPRRVDAATADLIRARTAHLGEIQQRIREIDQIMDRLDTHGTQLSLDLAGAHAAAARKRIAAEG